MKLFIQSSLLRLAQYSVSPQNNKARSVKTLGNCQNYNYFYIDLTLVKYQKILSPGEQLENTLVKLKVRTRGIF